MCKQKLDKFIDKDLSGNSTEVRFGLCGVAIGFLLFLLPLSLYFFDKGGILMLPSLVWVVIGAILTIVWILLFIFWVYVLLRWRKSRLQDTTHKELFEIQSNVEKIVTILEKRAKDEHKNKPDTKL